MDTILDSDRSAIKPNAASASERSDLRQAALVTNTESASPSKPKNVLQAPSLLALEKMQPISRRYIFQSVSKEMLGACTKRDESGEKHPFYRLGACQQLSSAFRPSSITQDVSHGLCYHGSYQSSIEDMRRQFAEAFSSSLSIKTDDNGISSVQMSGLCSCNSPWICPVCQPKVSDYRSQELAYAVHQHQSNDGYLLFVTFTVPHTRTDKLDKTLSGLTDSLRRFKSGKAFQGFKDRHGFIGSVRSLEWTWTEKNGHHPHVHELWFLDKKPDVKTIKPWVFEKYATLVLKHLGQVPSYKRGVDVKIVATESQLPNLYDGCNLNDIQALSTYITKGIDVDSSVRDFLNNRDWTIADEMTKANYKKSRRYKDGSLIKSYNASTILIEYLQLQHIVDTTGKKAFLKEMTQFKNVYNEYASATFGRAALYWSRGLKDRFGVYDMDDDLVINEHDSEFREFMSFTLDELQFIIKNRLRARLCDIASMPEHKNDEQRREAVRDEMQRIKVLGRVDRFG